MENSANPHHQIVLAISWTAMLLTSSLALIIWRELASGEPYWWAWVHASGLVVLLVLTFFQAYLKPLRSFILILFTIFFLGFGGGWQWGFIPFVRASPAWMNWESEAPCNSLRHRCIRFFGAQFSSFVECFCSGAAADSSCPVYRSN